MTPKIPRRIVQTGKSRDLPLLAKASAAGIRALNPAFEYFFFDDADVEAFIKEEFPQHLRLFHSFPIRIQRYDFFRYLAVYRLGGFYFDLDIFLACGIGDLLHFECVFPFEELTLHTYLRDECGMDWEIGNYAFGAAAGHPFLAALIDNCVRAQAEPRWVQAMLRPIPRLFRDEFMVLDTTGPGMASRTLARYSNAEHAVTVLFPDDVRDPATWHRFGHYGVHLQAATWRNRRGLLRRRLSRLWESRTRARLNKESRALGPARSLSFGRTSTSPQLPHRSVDRSAKDHADRVSAWSS